MTEMVQLKEMFWKLGSMLSLMNQISPDYWWPAATGHRDFVSYWTISPLIAWICVSPVVCEWFRTRVCSWLKLMAVVVVATVFRILFQNMYGTSNHAVGGLYVYGKTSLLGYMDSFVLGVFLFYRYHARNGNNNGASTISNGIRMGNMPYCHGSGTMVFVALGLLWFMLGCTYEDFVDLNLLSRNGSSVLSHLALHFSAACLITAIVVKAKDAEKTGWWYLYGRRFESATLWLLSPVFICLEWIGQCALSILLIHCGVIEQFFILGKDTPTLTEQMIYAKLLTSMMLTLLFAWAVKGLTNS